MVYRASHGGCPRCAARLERERSGPYRFERCASCRGVWMEPSTFAAMLEEMGAAVALETVVVDEEELACTVCSKAMVKRALFGIILDTCERDGIWFDNAELQKTLAGSAGLEVDPVTPLETSVSLLQQVLTGESD